MKGLSVTLITILIFLIIGEVLVRYLQDRNKPPSKVRQRDELTHHSLRPNQTDIARTFEWEEEIKINSLGFRDYEYTAKKPDNTFRILMVGDSFTEGQGVKLDETFSKVLERSLKDKIGNKKVEVINTGVLSYSPLLEYLFLKYRGVDLNPDLVIINFDQGDIIDDQWYEPELVRDDQGLPLKFRKLDNQLANNYQAKPTLPFLPLAVKKFFHENSRIYLVIADSLKEHRLILYPEIIENTVVPGNKGRDKLIATRDSVEAYDDLWKLAKQNLTLIGDLLKEKNIQLLITDYPYGHQVNATEWSEGRKKVFFDAKLYDNDREFETLEEFCESNRIMYHSTLNDFRTSKDHPLFLKYDGHFTSLGHVIMANSIEKYLLEKNLIK